MNSKINFYCKEEQSKNRYVCHHKCYTNIIGDIYLKKIDSLCDCELVKCNNYNICHNYSPKDSLGGHYTRYGLNSFCEGCETYGFFHGDHFYYGRWNYGKGVHKVHTTDKCSNCNNVTELYKQPFNTCAHLLCANCFYKTFYNFYGTLNDYVNINYPIFPYDESVKYIYDNRYVPDIYEKYLNEIEFQKWLNECKILDDIITLKIVERLDKCPSCN